jgi:hypothetical protein
MRNRLPIWALKHPHCCGSKPYGANDSIYISTDRIQLPGFGIDVPGAGVFKRYDALLCLTAEGASRSIWKLPLWYDPRGKKSSLTYHRDPKRWTLENEHIRLKTVERGQEFVLDCDDYPEAIEWVYNRLKLCKSPQSQR